MPHETSDAAAKPAAHLSPDELIAFLEDLGVAPKTLAHAAVFTVEESQKLDLGLPGAHTKNLFLKDKKGRFFLVSALKDARIDLKRLHEVIGGSGRLSFGTADQLMELLGVQPGSVCAFAVVNDRQGRVRMVLDAGLMRHELVNFHPLVNTMTTTVTREELLVFLRATGHDPLIVELPVPPDAEGDGQNGSGSPS